MAIQKLPDNTIKLIKSSQVITSVSSIVKELLENSIDAEASIISIKLENFGFDRIEIKDNGKGIAIDNMDIVAKAHTTSKITSFDDISHIDLYGFRGEALFSLCQLSDLSITTKTKEENRAYRYEFNDQGDVIKSTLAALPIGTSTCVQNLFKNMPIRRKYYANSANKKSELKRIQELLMAYGIINPNVFISLHHNRSTLYQKKCSNTINDALLSVFQSSAKKLSCKNKSLKEIIITAWLPEAKFQNDSNCSRNSCNRLFIFANKRPITSKNIEKIIKQYFSASTGGSHGGYPIGVVLIETEPKHIDVNLEPNKSKVLFENENDVLELLENILKEIYGTRNDDKIPCTLGNVDEASSCEESKNNANKYKTQLLTATGFDVNETSIVNESDYSILDVDQRQKANKSIQTYDDNIFNNNIKPISVLKCNSSAISNETNKYELSKYQTPIENDKETEIYNLSNGKSSLRIPSNVESSSNKEYILHNDDNLLQNRDFHKNSATIVDFRENNENIAVQYKLMQNHNFPKNISCKNTLHTIEDLAINSDAAIIDSESFGQNKITESTSTDLDILDNDIGLIKDICDNNEKSLSEVNKPKNIFARINESISRTNLSEDSHNRHFDSPFTKEINLDEWSRGNMISQRENIGTVHILKNPNEMNITKRQLDTPMKSNVKKKSKLVIFKNTNVCSSSGQLVPKPQSAFSLFAKETRRDVLSKNPDMNLTDVAKKNTSQEERTTFSNQKWKQQTRISDEFINSSITDSLERLVAPTTPKINNLRKGKNAKPWKSKQLAILFDVEKIKKKIINNRFRNTNNGVIGRLKDTYDWLYLNNGKIETVNLWRINEMNIFNVLMSTYRLNTSRLQNPIVINERVLGIEKWQVLIKLKQSSKANNIDVSDERIICNGFVIKLLTKNQVISSGEISEITQDVPLYGLSDLMEILNGIVLQNNIELRNSRPLKVRNWLKDECIRVNRSSSNITSRKGVSQKVNEWENNIKFQVCLHSMPICTTIVNI